jgi:hypothetical protein
LLAIKYYSFSAMTQFYTLAYLWNIMFYFPAVGTITVTRVIVPLLDFKFSIPIMLTLSYISDFTVQITVSQYRSSMARNVDCTT